MSLRTLVESMDPDQGEVVLLRRQDDLFLVDFHGVFVVHLRQRYASYIIIWIWRYPHFVNWTFWLLEYSIVGEMKQHCKESSSFCSQEFPEYVKKLTLTEKALTAQRPNSELSAGTPSELSRPITNHYKYRSQLSSAAGGSGHHRPSTSQDQSRSGHLPSFNEIKKTLREQILKKHH